jgi:hypothetical protein
MNGYKAPFFGRGFSLEGSEIICKCAKMQNCKTQGRRYANVQKYRIAKLQIVK